MCSFRLRHSLFGVLLAFAPACTDGGDDDDDSAADDDDDSAGTEMPEFDLCDGPELSYTEVEPNGGLGIVNQVNGATGNLTIRGVAESCSNDGVYWTGDRDVFEVPYACGGEAHFELSWTSDDPEADTSDLDLFVFDAYNDGPIVASSLRQMKDSDEGLESGSAQTGGTLGVEVLCWEGPAVDYTLRIEWLDAS